MHTVQLPGRGRRLAERSFSEIGPLVDALAGAVTPLLDKPFAFYGHSMGALVAFELGRQLRRQELAVPSRLFVAACGAPHLPRETKQINELPDTEFRLELRRLNGTPREVLEHDELMSLLIPMLRADFRVCETYAYRPEAAAGFPLTAIAGAGDVGMTIDHVRAWREHAAESFALYVLPGDHFFLHTQQAALLEIICEELADLGTTFASREQHGPTGI